MGGPDEPFWLQTLAKCIPRFAVRPGLCYEYIVQYFGGHESGNTNVGWIIIEATFECKVVCTIDSKHYSV